MAAGVHTRPLHTIGTITIEAETADAALTASAAAADTALVPVEVHDADTATRTTNDAFFGEGGTVTGRSGELVSADRAACILGRLAGLAATAARSDVEGAIEHDGRWSAITTGCSDHADTSGTAEHLTSWGDRCREGEGQRSARGATTTDTVLLIPAVPAFAFAFAFAVFAVFAVFAHEHSFRASPWATHGLKVECRTPPHNKPKNMQCFGENRGLL